MAGEAVGKNAYFQWIYATSKGGAPAGTVTIQGRYRTFKANRSGDTAEITAGNDTEKSYLDTTRDKTFDMTYLYQGTAGTGGGTVASALHRALAQGNWGTLLWGLEGTATGKPKWGIVGYIKDSSYESKYDKEIEFDVSWQGDGAWLFDYEGSGSVW